MTSNNIAISIQLTINFSGELIKFEKNNTVKMRIQDALCILTGYLEMLLSAGLVLGWPSLQYTLQREGFFSYLCTNQTEINDVAISDESSKNNSIPATCNESEASFNLVFTIAVFSGYGFQIILGYLFDRFGTWKFRSLIISIFTVGTFLLAFTTPSTSYLLYPSMMLLELGGSGVLTSNMQIANLAKPIRGIIISLINGLLASSVVVFFTVKKGYDAGIELRYMLFSFPLISAFLWIRTFVLMPKKFIPAEFKELTIKYGYKEWRCFKRRQISRHFAPLSIFVVGASPCVIKVAMESQEEKQTKDISFKTCLKNILFWTNMFHFSFVSFRVSFVFGTLQQWLNSFADPTLISKLTDDLGIILLCAIFVAPLNGIVFDAVAKKITKETNDEQVINLRASIVSLSIISICCVMLSVMSILYNPYGTFVFVVLCRSFSLGGAITFISVNFPSQHIGKLTGLTFFVYGLTALLQYPLVQLAFVLDPTFYYIHIGMSIFATLTIIHPLMIYLSTKKSTMLSDYENKRLEDTLKITDVRASDVDLNLNTTLAVSN